MTSRKIAPSGAGRKHAARGSLTFLPGGAGTEASPDWSEGEGWGIAAHPSPHPKVGSAAEGTEGSALESEQNMAVCWDKYAAIHLSKEIHLPPMPAHVLWTLVLLADHRSHAWTGTLGELALDVITSRSTVSRAMKDLADRGLIEYAEPFTRNKPGIVVINVYRLISPDYSSPSRRKAVDESLPRRRPDLHAESSDDQHFRDSPRDKGAIREEEDARESLTRGVKPDEAIGGAYLRLRQAFPGAEEVS